MKAKDWNRAYIWGLIGALIYCLAFWVALAAAAWWVWGALTAVVWWVS